MGWDGEKLLKPIRQKASKQSGIKGITWNKKKEKWMHREWVNGKMKNIGEFYTLEEAIESKNKFIKNNYMIKEGDKVE